MEGVLSLNGLSLFSELMNKSYYEKLKDPRWQKKRLQIMQRDAFTCRHCGDTEETLNVHHKQYFKNKDPWDYEDKDLMTLCEVCHSETSDLAKAISIACSEYPWEMKEVQNALEISSEERYKVFHILSLVVENPEMIYPVHSLLMTYFNDKIDKLLLPDHENLLTITPDTSTVLQSNGP